jgi:signal peptidase I
MKDGTREVIETVVFVVVLVLLLKTFLAEAFVIPTGSMATTLLGYHQELTCEMCGYRFLVNASSEAEGPFKQFVTKGYCPNCRRLNTIRRPLPEDRGEAP